jgi:hypothetical protein
MAGAFGGLYVFLASGIIIPEANTGTVTAGNYAITRNAAGDWSWNNVAGAATVVFTADASNLARPYFTFPAFPGQGNTLPTSNEWLEVFGTAAGGPGNPFSGIASNSATVQGSQFGTPFVPWGYSVVDVVAVYSVQTAALTAATLALNRNIFVENTATVNTSVLAATAVALTTTTSATTPHVQKVALAQPLTFESADMSGLVIELSITAAATSAVRVYGLAMHVVAKYL